MTTAVEEIVELNNEVEESLQTHVEVQIKKDVMQNIIKRVERSKEKKGVVPIKQGIYLHFGEDQITARALNNDYSTQVIVKKTKDNYTFLEGASGGAVFMDPKLSSMVNSMPRKNIKLSIHASNAVISAGRTSFELKTLDSLEFPQFMDNIEGPEVKLHSDVLKRMYVKTTFAASTLETRPALTGVQHKVKDKRFSLAATDSYRLATITQELDEEVEEINTVIPAPALSEIQKQLDDSVSQVSIRFSKSSVAYSFDNGTTIISRVIDSPYPDISKLIPDQFTTEIQFRVDEIRELVKRAMLVDQENSVQLLVKAEALQARFISRESEKAGFVEDISPTEGEGKDVKLGLNIRYLLDTLNHHSPNSLIKMQFVSNSRPIIIRLVDGDQDNLDLVLPVKLAGNDNPEDVVIEDFRGDIQIKIEDGE
ncbi:DNA polymerase III subunit beta [Virgibacillus salexigens]|uniref:Beta sliding clamp n=1 Tax=Virgibacillus massiliensis TaxID=1462526 RepID=A0A024QHH1_9BACI|nr:DNA polymerase III subunit beta [Virgibacillus massiliensis]CDQ41939.1 DNA polymerase III subunit beta [Virgibacillus massiliensis]